MSLSKTLYPLLVLVQPRKTGNCSDITEKLIDSDLKHQNKQIIGYSGYCYNTSTLIFKMKLSVMKG